MTDDEIISFFNEHPGASPEDLARVLRVSIIDAEWLINRLTEIGKLVRIQDERN